MVEQKTQTNLTLNVLEKWFDKILAARLEDCHDFETIMGYIVNSRQARPTQIS